MNSKFNKVLKCLSIGAISLGLLSGINFSNNTLTNLTTVNAKRRHRRHYTYRHHESTTSWYLHNSRRIFNRGGLYSKGSNDVSEGDPSTAFLNKKYIHNSHYRQGWIVEFCNVGYYNYKSRHFTYSRMNRAIKTYNRVIKYSHHHRTQTGFGKNASYELRYNDSLTHIKL